MEDAGIRVYQYGPLFPWRPRWSWLRRDHRKLLVVDGTIGFAGGINICDDEAPPLWGGRGWRDLHVRVEGPSARDMQRAFLATWRRGSGVALDRKKHLTRVDPSGKTAVRVVGNFWIWNRRSIRRSLLYAVRAAKKSIYVENAYFLPDERLLRALRRAVRRGVDVRVVVPGYSDVRVVEWATRALYPRLLKAGIRVFEWKGAMLHAKAACIDGMWSTIGSFNLDRWSAVDNIELTVNILDKHFGAGLAEVLEADMRKSQEITELPRRGLLERVVDRGLLALARWL
jgi:cardiolipin synthase